MLACHVKVSEKNCLLGRGARALADEFLEFRVIVEAIEIGIFGRPILVAVSGSKRLLQRLERLRFFSQGAVGAGSIVEGAGIEMCIRDRNKTVLIRS